MHFLDCLHKSLNGYNKPLLQMKQTEELKHKPLQSSLRVGGADPTLNFKNSSDESTSLQADGFFRASRRPV